MPGLHAVLDPGRARFAAAGHRRRRLIEFAVAQPLDAALDADGPGGAVRSHRVRAPDGPEGLGAAGRVGDLEPRAQIGPLGAELRQRNWEGNPLDGQLHHRAQRLLEHLREQLFCGLEDGLLVLEVAANAALRGSKGVEVRL